MAKYTDLTGANDYSDYSKISPLIGKDYSGGHGRQTSNYGPNSFDSRTEYKLASSNLSNLAMEVTRISKRILTTTANTVSRAMGGINQDLGINSSKLIGMSLIKISPILGYVVAKTLESGALSGVYNKLKSGIGSMFRTFFTWAGIDTSSVKGFVKGVIGLPFKLLGGAIIGIAKLPFRAISVAAKTMIWLAKLPWKIIYGGMSAIFKVAAIIPNMLIGLAKIPFKLLGRMLGFNPNAGGGNVSSGVSGYSQGGGTLPDRQLQMAFKPMNDSLTNVNKTLKRTMIILAGLAIGLIGARGLVSGSLRAAIASTGIGMTAGAGYLLSKLIKPKHGENGTEKQGPISSVLSRVFSDDGGILGKLKGGMSGASNIVLDPFTQLSKGRVGSIATSLERAISGIEGIVEDTMKDVVSKTQDKMGPMPKKGILKQLGYVAGFGARAGLSGAWRLGKEGVGTSWDAATSTLHAPKLGIEGALDEFTAKRKDKYNTKKQSDERWGNRFKSTDTFFKSWGKQSAGLPLLGQLLSFGVRAPLQGMFGIGKFATRLIGEPVENAFRKVMSDEKVTKKLGKGFFSSLIALAIPLLGFLTSGTGGLIGMILKPLLGLGKMGLQIGGTGLILKQLFGVLFDTDNYIKKMTGMDNPGTGASIIGGLAGVLTGGSAEGGWSGMLRGMMAGAALTKSPWGIAIGGVAGLIGTRRIAQFGDLLLGGDEKGSLGTAIYDAVHATNGWAGGMKAFFAAYAQTKDPKVAMAAFSLAYASPDTSTLSTIPGGKFVPFTPVKKPSGFWEKAATIASSSSAYDASLRLRGIDKNDPMTRLAMAESSGEHSLAHKDVNEFAYGAIQVHASQMSKHLKFLKKEGLPVDDLMKLTPGTEDFNTAWRKFASKKNYPNAPATSPLWDATKKWAKQEYIDPMFSKLGHLGPILKEKSNYDSRIPVIMATLPVNMGQDAAAAYIKKRFYKADVANLDPQQIVDALLNPMIDHTADYFPTLIGKRTAAGIDPSQELANISKRYRDIKGEGNPGGVAVTQTPKDVAANQVNFAAAATPGTSGSSNIPAGGSPTGSNNPTSVVVGGSPSSTTSNTTINNGTSQSSKNFNINTALLNVVNADISAAVGH